MKEDLRILVQEFMDQTKENRTEYTAKNDIPVLREPDFVGFINWLNHKS